MLNFKKINLALHAYQSYQSRRGLGDDLEKIMRLIENEDCPMPLTANEGIPAKWKTAVATLYAKLKDMQRWNESSN